MKVLNELPPNYAEITEAVGIPPLNAVFTYGNTVYAPSLNDVVLPDDLEVHERKHEHQQTALGGPDLWWACWLKDEEFRFRNELSAYRDQYTYICVKHSDPQHKYRELTRLATDFALMYGFKWLTVDAAKKLISEVGG